MASFHTVICSLAWTLFYISQDPDVQDKIHEEIDSVLGENEVSYSHVSKLRYMNQVIREAMRMQPAGAMAARKLTEDVEIGTRYDEDGDGDGDGDDVGESAGDGAGGYR